MGGGSGGHITPIVAVIKRLRSPEVIERLGGEPEIRVWCDRKFSTQAHQLMPDVRVDIIAAGKFRRYANLNFWYRTFSPWHIWHTHIPNFIDAFKFLGGVIQSLIKMLIWRPDVVFCKGGYVSLPVGLVAHLYHIPLVIHDSDTVPGLTNRILARYADAIGTGAPTKNYPNYPKSKTKYVGIPVASEAKTLTVTEKAKMRKALGLSEKCPVVLAMGGGLGAVAINDAMTSNAQRLLNDGSEIILLIGKGREVNLRRQKRLHIYQFTDKALQMEQVADVVVTRAGATTMAELAAVGAATIIVPSPYLAGDHQTKNAKVYEKAGAALYLSEFEMKKKPAKLGDMINNLLDDDKERETLKRNLKKFAKPDALNDMAAMIVSAIRKSER